MTTYKATGRDLKNKKALHFFRVQEWGSFGRDRQHVLDGQKCWCKPGIETDWERMQDGQPYISIVHEGFDDA